MFYVCMLIYLFVYFTISYWFCHTLTWICNGCTCVLHPEPPSHLSPHPIPLGHPSAPPPICLVAQLYLTFCDHMDCSLPDSFVHGIFQARILQEYWRGLSFSTPEGLPNPDILCWPASDQASSQCTKLELSTFWPFTEKVCLPLI